jgi:sugar phosphate permease
MIYLLNLVPFGFGFGVLLLFIGMLLIMRMPITESYIVSQTHESNRSTILGIYYFSALEGGGVLNPVMGYLIEHFGFYTSFIYAGAALILVTLICFPFLFSSRR